MNRKTEPRKNMVNFAIVQEIHDASAGIHTATGTSTPQIMAAIMIAKGGLKARRARSRQERAIRKNGQFVKTVDKAQSGRYPLQVPSSMA